MGSGSSQPRQERQVLSLSPGRHGEVQQPSQEQVAGIKPRCTCVQSTALGATAEGGRHRNRSQASPAREGP